MTNWRAVGIGLAVEFVLGIVGLIVPGVGQFVAGLVGGFVAVILGANSAFGGAIGSLVNAGRSRAAPRNSCNRPKDADRTTAAAEYEESSSPQLADTILDGRR